MIDLVRPTSGGRRKRQESRQLPNLRKMCILPGNEIFLRICNSFHCLPFPRQLNIFLHPQIEFEGALRGRIDISQLKTLTKCTLTLRKVFLFSLHHANASVQLRRDSASSMQRISKKRSMSTSVWAIQFRNFGEFRTYLNTLFFSDHSC